MNKGIKNIKYNHLNQPTEVDFETKKTKHTYTATGVKLKTQIFTGTKLEAQVTFCLDKK